MLTMVYANARGEIFAAEGVPALGRSGDTLLPLTPEDVIPLPESADLMLLPGRMAAGGAGQPRPERLAVAAVLPAGYTRTLLPAYTLLPDHPVLPLYGYTAVAIHRGRFYAAAVRSDRGEKWDPRHFNTPDLGRRIKAGLAAFPRNRIIAQLARCSREYHCFTAQNIFYRRWEGGIPVSPACNARCLGCISLQPAECCPSPQTRIDFIPTVEEIVAVGEAHLAVAPEGIVSFGQGCEGEPALQADLIAAAIAEMRRRTLRGVINLNTNAGHAPGIITICDAGLDSMRVSLISAREPVYHLYYRPQGYTLADVKASIRAAKARGVYVSLNLLVFPGVTDREEEVAALLNFIADTGIDMVQLRNLNIDPDFFMSAIPPAAGRAMGIREFIAHLKARFPRLAIGSYSRYVRKDEPAP